MKKIALFIIMSLFLIGCVSADTLILYPTNASDGHLYRGGTNSSYNFFTNYVNTSNLYDTTAVTGHTRVDSDILSNTYKRNYKFVVKFPTTSSFLSNDTLTNASLHAYRSNSYTSLGNGSTLLNIAKFTPSGTIDTNDWIYIDNTSLFSTGKTVSSMGTSQYYAWFFNNFGITNISRGSDSAFSIVFESMQTLIPPSPWVASSYLGVNFYTADNVANPPYLQLEITHADVTPPKSVSNLQNSTPACGESNITWTNPSDPDLDVIEILVNNTWNNQSNTTTHLLLTGLPESSPMTINISTRDLSGNRNITHIQNLSFITGSCFVPDTTPPKAVTNLTNSTPSCGESEITWGNPPDLDLGIIAILINGTWNNQTNTTEHLDLDGLPELSGMTVNITTVDLTGNQNLTHWNNISFVTGPCGVPPVADFVADDTTICTADIVSFTDLSTNTPSSWYYDFGDFNSSTSQNPTHNFNNTGNYSVNLTVSNLYGADYVLKTNYITVGACFSGGLPGDHDPIVLTNPYVVVYIWQRTG